MDACSSIRIQWHRNCHSAHIVPIAQRGSSFELHQLAAPTGVPLQTSPQADNAGKNIPLWRRCPSWATVVNTAGGRKGAASWRLNIRMGADVDPRRVSFCVALIITLWHVISMCIICAGPTEWSAKVCASLWFPKWKNGPTRVCFPLYSQV